MDFFWANFHMDTPALTITHHLWQIPDLDVTLEYFCEVPGHRALGMFGVFKIGAGSSVESSSNTLDDNNFLGSSTSSSLTASIGIAIYSTIFALSFMFIWVNRIRHN